MQEMAHNHGGRPRGLRSVAVALACTVGVLLSSGNAWAAGEFEPNDFLGQTAGPLAGGTGYTATFETTNDEDWFRFYVVGQRQLSFTGQSIGAANKCDSSSSDASVELLEGDGDDVGVGFSFTRNRVGSTSYTTPGAGVYVLRITRDNAEVGCTYLFRIDPAISIVANDTCGQALISREVNVRAIKKAKAKKAQVTSRKKRRKFQAVIKQLRPQLQQAISTISATCPQHL